jgi:MinD-like ATPase involved in chromosome partitioning or flagellar assembly
MSDRAVRVVGPSGGRDLKLPAELPIDSLLPAMLEAVGGNGSAAPLDPSRWRLVRSENGEGALARTSSLAESGILDGTTLYLASDAAPEEERRGPVTESLKAEPPHYGHFARISMAIGAFFGWSRTAARQGDRPAAESAQGDPLKPTGPTPASLTALPPLTRGERARQVWRATDYTEQLEALIAGPQLSRCVTIAVLSPKGGVGKTTITSLLGMLLSMLRPDRVVAVDANPDYGSLGRALVPDHHIFVDDFLSLMDSKAPAAAALEAQLGRARHGLLVLPAPTDPARMWGLREQEYARVIERLQQYVGVLLLDCGTGLQDSSTSAAIAAADQCVLVTEADPAAASLVAEAGTLLAGGGRPITLVVNKMPRKRSLLALERFREAVPFASSLVVVRNEPRAAGQLTTSQFDWRSSPASWQLALRRLAVALSADWAGLGLTVRPTESGAADLPPGP